MALSDQRENPSQGVAMRIAVLAIGIALFCSAGCGDSGSRAQEGGACQDDLGCASNLICFVGTCRHPDCQELDCQDGWACIDGLCCNQTRCCGVEGLAREGTCSNGLDDDCDGWTDGLDSDCEQGCSDDAECDDQDECTLDRCVQGECENGPTPEPCCAGTGGFSASTAYPAADDGLFLSAADLDGDGLQDLTMGTDNEHAVVVLPGLAGGAFGAKQVLGTGSNPWATVLEDLDGDSRVDIAAADYSGSVVVWLNQSPGPGQLAFSSPNTVALDGSPLDLVAGDFDANGTLDLAATARQTDRVVLLLGDGAGGFTAAGRLPTGDEPWWVAAGDLNEDGLLDLAVTNNQAGTLSVLLADGPASFAPKVDLAVSNEPQAVLVVDLDLDGHLDLVVANRGAGTVSILVGNGDGSFAPAQERVTEPGGGPIALATGDLNADGWPDLVVANNATDSLSVLLSTGDGALAAGVQYPAPERPSGVVVRDLDGDGVLDLATSCSRTDDVRVLLGEKTCR